MLSSRTMFEQGSWRAPAVANMAGRQAWMGTGVRVMGQGWEINPITGQGTCPGDEEVVDSPQPAPVGQPAPTTRGISLPIIPLALGAGAIAVGAVLLLGKWAP